MPPARFPPGDIVFLGRAFQEDIFGVVDQLLSAGHCPDGSLDLDTPHARLSCLIHGGKPHLAGLQEQGRFVWVPLAEFPARARELQDATCTLTKTDPFRVLLCAVHFRNTPVLQGSTEMVALPNVLDKLAKKGQDAVLALERGGARTVMFLRNGVPAKLYFGNPSEDPGGGELKERLLYYAQGGALGLTHVELFERLNIHPDPAHGTPLRALAEAAKPPPQTILQVRSEGKDLFQQPFLPPTMVFGREHTCELLLDHLSVSRQHTRLSWEKGAFVVEDLGSANGTSLAGRAVQRANVPLGAAIGVGVFEIQLFQPLLQLVNADNKTMMIGSGPNAQAHLVSEKLSVPIVTQVLIGKAPGVDVPAVGMGVRPVHARIRRESAVSYRLDCFDGGKVLLNDKKVLAAHLRFGDKIKIGKSTFWLVSKI